MTGRHWIFLTIGSLVAIVGLVASVGYAIDPYGVLRDPRGRKLSIYFSEGKAKCLMNKRYVPSNFDGLVVGPSSLDNWKLSTLAGATVYNESLAGGNAAEERMLVSQALERGHFKLAIFVLVSSMTSSHELKDGLDTVKTSEAIGSIHVLVHEVAYALKAMHVPFEKSDAAPNGTAVFEGHGEIDVHALPPSNFAIDPVALEDFRSMVQAVRDRGARIVYVVPPLYEPLYEVNRASYAAYLDTIRRALPPAPVIDFDGPEYASLRSDPDNFRDCFHLNPTGAAAFTALLEKLVPEAIASSN
jgi:hypothetical protein